LLPLLVAGCNLYPSIMAGAASNPNPNGRNMTGTWNLILHMEAITNDLLEYKMIIRGMQCQAGACKLDGYLEENSFDKIQRHALNASYYYPGQELVRLDYDYKTIKNELREAVIIFDTFPTGKVPQDAMAGHVVIYDLQARSVYLTPEDESILEITHKGKAEQAGQVTAWKAKNE
jgi:hypothetical protein